MTRAGKRQRNKDIVFSDGEETITDAEWTSIRESIKLEMNDDNLTWEAILVYHEMEDDMYWHPLEKPYIYDFIQEYKEMKRNYIAPIVSNATTGEWETA